MSTLQLRPYQVEGRDWLRSRPEALLLDQMGVGKTPQALAALPDRAPVLIVVPNSLKLEWYDAARAWRPDYRLEVLYGTGSFRWPDPGEALIINYDILPPCTREITKRRKKGGAAAAKLDELKRLAKAVGKAPHGTVIVADEAHCLGRNKTQQTMRFRNLRTRAVRAGNARIWGLTGTPLLNKPPELWNLLTTFRLCEQSFGSWPRFLRAFNAVEGEWGIEYGRPALNRVVPALKRVAKRRLKRQVLPELPAKTYRHVRVDLGENDAALADAAIEELRAAGVNILTAAAEAMAIAAGRTSFTTLSRARTALAAAKISAAVELVEAYEEQSEPLVVMSDHRKPVEVIGSRPGWDAIHGGVSSPDRARIVRRFQAGELRGVAATIGAGGVGLTLHRASNMLFVDRCWTPLINEQAEDRIHRYGQRRAVQIIDLVADHMLDRRIAEVCGQKTELAAAIDGIAEREEVAS